MNITKYFELKKEIELNTDLELFENEFINSEYKNFSFYRSGSNQFTVEAKISVGTVRINNYKSIPITTTLELSKRGDQNYATLRNGIGLNSIIITISILVILIMLAIFSGSNEAIGIVTISLISLVWFWLIFRGQEEILQACVIKSIKDINQKYEENNF
ncbi:hypothetical protein [Flavobacterium terrigena]|uniref:Uncharacterized protein n=1 Tax=Flavobacterium terrigena TaxID=402734 RepID=A0A1H6QJ01_9FLAO|nr:hypothetical protein [Flavobacterium terrigena]SEI43623.1 hypothetical protein SAMN05660918_0560 [Flavobacterium terrigena]